VPVFEGRIVAIYTAPDAGGAMQEHERVVITPTGIEGDRYAAGSGRFSDTAGGGRHVTLVEREAVAAINAEGTELGEAETRRNLVTEGVPLNHLVGREFTVGDVRLRGVRLSEPCSYLEGMTRPGLRLAALHRLGLRAEVVATGEVRVGDTVVAAD
jgi:MOSC domain-containing protein YiiM